MHGYEAGTTEPTTELLLSHKHPDDYAEVAEALEYVRRTHAAIEHPPSHHRRPWPHARGHRRQRATSRRHRLSDRTQRFLIDVTPSGRSRAQAERDREQAVTEALAGIAESREVIDQAKGMIMLVYQVEADKAFDLLNGGLRPRTSNSGCWPSSSSRTSWLCGATKGSPRDRPSTARCSPHTHGSTPPSLVTAVR